MNPSLYRFPRPTVTDEREDGTRSRARPATNHELLQQGYRVEIEVDGEIVCHAAPGVRPPAGATVYEDGRSGKWTWGDVRRKDQALADKLLLGRVRTTRRDEKREMVPAIVTERMEQVKAHSLTDIEEVDVAPHTWAGHPQSS